YPSSQNTILASVTSRLNTRKRSPLRLLLARRPKPKRSLFSSRKFCSICILRLYSFMIFFALNSAVLLNINHGSLPAAFCSFSVVGEPGLPLARPLFLPLGECL